MGGSAAFVGRASELSRLLETLAGDTRLVVVTGDAGVGKTRFVGEGMARAAAGGMMMVQGECLPVAGTLPLLPVVAALGELARLDGGTVLEEALGAAGGVAGGASGPVRGWCPGGAGRAGGRGPAVG